MKRQTYKVNLESEGRLLAATTAYAWNSALDKGRALLRTLARATGEAYTVQNADTVQDDRNTRYDRYGIIQPWRGDRSGRIAYIVVQRVEPAAASTPSTPSVLDYDTMTGIYDPAPRH